MSGKSPVSASEGQRSALAALAGSRGRGDWDISRPRSERQTAQPSKTQSTSNQWPGCLRGGSIGGHRAPRLPACETESAPRPTLGYNDGVNQGATRRGIMSRITFDPAQCGGRPCIRGMRIRVKDVLELLAAGVSEAEILTDYPYLEPEDIRASLAFAAAEVDHPVLLTAAK
jgi:uncharacterized protein (DUF433 family)